MKQLLFLMAMVLFISAPNLLFAQATTLDISASEGNLNDIIEADTLADGTQAHDVYRLVSLDMTYKFTGTITATGDITVRGVVDPSTGRPPCIQPAVLPDASIPPTIFTLNGAGIKGTFENLYLLALATNNTANGGGVAIQVSGDNVRLTMDNCVFDGWQTFAIGYNGQWDDFFITNCHFRNMVHPNQWYIGEVIRNEWPGEAYTDTMSFVGNTMLGINGYAAAPVTKWYTKYFEFIDNKVLYTFKNPFFIFNVTDAKINDNVFYGNYAGGVDQAEHPWWDNLWYPDSTYGVIALQPLNADNKTMFHPADTSLAEGLRKVEVKDNTYFWPTALTSFWDNWNNTQTNKIRTPGWMNERTIAMFADDATYPYLVESGNVNVDPGYMGPIDTDVLNGTTGNDIGLLAYFEQIRLGTAATDIWGYGYTQVSGAADWTPTWPLPEASHIATSVEDDLISSVPTTFTLSDIYPNPFNPGASVEYTLSEAGVTSLKVYNVLGQCMKTLVDNVFQTANTYKISFDMSEYTSGVYFVVLKQGGNSTIRKMMLLR
jgi:hypothetical protein